MGDTIRIAGRGASDDIRWRRHERLRRPGDRAGKSFALLRIRAEYALAAVSIVALLLVAITILGNGRLAGMAIVGCGLFNSVMWPCIFPLSVKGLGRFTSQGSGILVMMVVGGAVIPELQGLLADKFGYQHSFAIVC